MAEENQALSQPKECPNCGQQIPSDSDNCPDCGRRIEPTGMDYTRLAQKIAGIILIINGIFLLVEAGVFEASGSSNRFSGIAGNFIIGFLILKGTEKGLKWARIGICLGLVLYPIIYFVQNDIFMGVYQIIFSLTLLALLFGKPGKTRIAVSIGFVLIYFTMEIIGIHAELTGENLFGKVATELNYDLVKIEDCQVCGRAFDYTMKVPPKSSWKKMSDANALQKNPDADIWLINPDYDAHVIVVAESLFINLGSLAKAVISNSLESISNSQLKDSLTIYTESGIQGKMFDIQGIVSGLNISYKYGIFTENECVYQIICFSSDAAFPKIKHEFGRIISSFSLLKGNRL